MSQRIFFQYCLEGKYLNLCPQSDYAKILSEYDVLICVLTEEHMCQLDTALYPTEKMSWCLYTLIISSANQIKTYCNYGIKPQIPHIVYFSKKKLWAVVHCL